MKLTLQTLIGKSRLPETRAKQDQTRLEAPGATLDSDMHTLARRLLPIYQLAHKFAH